MRRTVLVAMVCAILYAVYGWAGNLEASTAWHNEQVVVHSGDTMWSIAARWTDKGEDVREVIYRMQQENKDITVGYLQPGQKVLVPVRITAPVTASR